MTFSVKRIRETLTIKGGDEILAAFQQLEAALPSLLTDSDVDELMI